MQSWLSSLISPSLLPTYLRHVTQHLFWKLCLVAAVLNSLFLFTGWFPHAADAQQEHNGLITEWRALPDQRLFVIQSPGRFEIHLDSSGIVAWYDLQFDPERRTNLVVPGAHLLEHRDDTENTLLSGTLVLQEQSFVKVHVTWQGQAGSENQSFTIDYTIWAGGQIAVSVHSAGDIRTTLQRDPGAMIGAALQSQPPTIENDGTTTQTLMLFLNAWTEEENGPLTRQPTAPQLAAGTTPFTYDPLSGAIQSQAGPDATVRLQLPPDIGLRQPRFEIAAWPDATPTVRLNETVLVAGQDYLADWDARSQALTLQYLYPVVTSAHQPATFELTAEPAVATVSLAIKGRSINPTSGNLIVDGNLPGYNGVNSMLDTFEIPYIQTTPDFVATAALQGDGAGVEFVVTYLGNGTIWSQTDRNEPYEAPFTMPTYGEYRLDAYILGMDGKRLNTMPDDTINPVGYGHIFVTIGDSITAGKFGDWVRPGDQHYPVGSCDGLSVDERSADCRNFYQYDNYNEQVSGVYQDIFYRGFQVDLNDNLAQCKQDKRVPVFILNDGFSGIRTSSGSNNNVLDKVPAYRSHIHTLGAQYVLLQVGTNDASGTTYSADQWETAMKDIIANLRTDLSHDLTIWVAHLPWRSDSVARANRTAAYNSRIPNIISATNTGSDPVYEGPDFFKLFQDNPELLNDPVVNDALHPSQEGFERMAQWWASGSASQHKNPICSKLPDPSAPPLTSTPTATDTPTATSTPSDPNVPTATATSMPITPPEPSVTPGPEPVIDPSQLYLPILVQP